MIPYGRQTITQQDIDAVISVLKADYLTQGPKVIEFEQSLSAKVGSRYAVACNSATSALHLACISLGVNSNSIVWTTPITFVASANCARYCGANVDFVDVDVLSGNMCPDFLQLKLEQASENGNLPDVVIPVHYSGIPCDMKRIKSLSQTYGFKIIEDASHALGARHSDVPVGSCQYSDITVFSFHPVKMITTGEGGAAVTNDFEVAKKIRMLSSHGVTKNEDELQFFQSEPWVYEQQELGYNYRMTDIQAALGLSQLKRLDSWVVQRNKLIERYKACTKHLPVEWLLVPKTSLASYHLAVIQVDSAVRSALFKFFRSQGVWVQVHYIPVNRQPYYLAGDSNIECPRADQFYSQVISLPLYPSLLELEQDKVVSILKSFFR